MKKQEKLFSFVKKAIAFRKDHPILHMPNELRSVDYMAKGFPDVSFHGERAWFLNMENTSRLIGIMYCGAYAQKPDGTDDDFLYIGYTFHWEKRNIALPNLPDGMTWKKIADTVRGIVSPATPDIFKMALSEGIIDIFHDAGFAVTNPTCGACLGMSNGVLADGEVCASTTNRNFYGRMGKGGTVHLMSPATAAATALAGVITNSPLWKKN